MKVHLSGLMLGLATLLAFQAPALTAEKAKKPDARGIAFSEKSIRPILVKQCYKCHSADSKKVKGGLPLDTRAGLLKGGETGPAVVPGNVKKSLLIEALHHNTLRMPPKGKLPAARSSLEATLCSEVHHLSEPTVCLVGPRALDQNAKYF